MNGVFSRTKPLLQWAIVPFGSNNAEYNADPDTAITFWNKNWFYLSSSTTFWDFLPFSIF